MRLFVLLCAFVCVLSLLPPDLGRWFAIALLVLVALTPAVRGRVQPIAEEVGEPSEEKAASG